MSDCSTAPTVSTERLVLKRLHSFFVGGGMVALSDRPRQEIVTVPGLPARLSDPNGHYQVGQMYGQFYELAAPRCALPLLMWHGGGMTGATWGDTPDGRPGWHDYFMRAGFNTCISDAVERGRASWAPYPDIYGGQPEHRTIDQAWSIFRFGPAGGYARGEGYAGQQFPVAHADELARQFVARWASNQALTIEAYGALLAKFGRSLVVAHSEGARYALQAAALWPERVAAVVLIEPAGSPGLDVSLAQAAAQVPHLVVWGDFFAHSKLWQDYRLAADGWLAQVRAHGGAVSCLDLPAMGTAGNSHLPMMDANSHSIAAQVAGWLGKVS